MYTKNEYYDLKILESIALKAKEMKPIVKLEIIKVDKDKSPIN